MAQANGTYIPRRTALHPQPSRAEDGFHWTNNGGVNRLGKKVLIRKACHTYNKFQSTSQTSTRMRRLCHVSRIIIPIQSHA